MYEALGEKLTVTGAVVRNPLSVIAMFVLLVEIIATVTLVKLHSNNFVAAVLVLFVSLFPVLVAFLFFYTIWMHHQHLYSPMEFRSDASFLSAMRRLEEVEAKQEAADINPRTADETESLRVIDRLLKLDDVRSAVKVGKTFLNARQFEIAWKIFDYILKSVRDNHNDRYNALANKSYAEIGLGLYAEAIQHLEEVIRDPSSRKGPWHYLALAYAYFKLSKGEGDKSHSLYQEYLSMAKNHHWWRPEDIEYNKRLYPEIAHML